MNQSQNSLLLQLLQHVLSWLLFLIQTPELRVTQDLNPEPCSFFIHTVSLKCLHPFPWLLISDIFWQLHNLFTYSWSHSLPQNVFIKLHTWPLHLDSNKQPKPFPQQHLTSLSSTFSKWYPQSTSSSRQNPRVNLVTTFPCVIYPIHQKILSPPPSRRYMKSNILFSLYLTLTNVMSSYMTSLLIILPYNLFSTWEDFFFQIFPQTPDGPSLSASPSHGTLPVIVGCFALCPEYSFQYSSSSSFHSNHSSKAMSSETAKITRPIYALII